MPRPKSPLELSTHKLRLAEGDFEAMGMLYPNMGATGAIRKLVNEHVKRMRAAVSPVDLDPVETEALIDG